jgi:hypothetical protein
VQRRRGPAGRCVVRFQSASEATGTGTVTVTGNLKFNFEPESGSTCPELESPAVTAGAGYY